MQIILSDFMSLDGVVQARGGREEDTEGGFAHGGWSFRYFDEEAMGPVIDELMKKTEALLFGRRTWQTMAAAWARPCGGPLRRPHDEIPNMSRLERSVRATSGGRTRPCCRVTTR